MNSSSKVSIIVAIYKSEPFLEKLINSLINQTYKNIEIVLIDDGSPDGSGIICDKFAVGDDRIKVIHKENGGACEARNCGLKEATGEYIVIVDGDDWLEYDYVEYMMNIIVKTKATMALSDKIFTTRDRIQTQNDKIEVWTAEDATCAILYPKMEIGPWSKIYSKKLLIDNNINFSVPWSGEGLYFSSKAAQFSNYVGVGHRKVYNYRLNNSESGLTNFNVQMGINAYNNIRTIGKELHIKTKKTRNAVNYHIWHNYWFIIFLITATKSKDKHKELYNECICGIRKKLFKVIFNSDVSIKNKLGMIRKAIFPVLMAKKVLNEKKKNFANDNYE